MERRFCLKENCAYSRGKQRRPIKGREVSTKYIPCTGEKSANAFKVGGGGGRPVLCVAGESLYEHCDAERKGGVQQIIRRHEHGED